MPYRRNRMFTRLMGKGFSFRAEISHTHSIGNIKSYIFKTKELPKGLTMPKWAIKKVKGGYLIPIDIKYAKNDNIKNWKRASCKR